MHKLPFVTLSQVQGIIDRYPTPFHLYDAAGIRASAQSVNRAFSWSAGFSVDEIMFSSNETLPEAYEEARRMNAIINLDDITIPKTRAFCFCWRAICTSCWVRIFSC